MPLPNDLSAFCVNLDVGPGEICITMPGGAQVCASVSAEITDPTDAVRSALGSVNAAIAPLKPIFDIVDLAASIVVCLKAVPDAITAVPPDPRKLAACVPEVAKKLEALLRLIPQVSIPLMIIEILNALIQFLQGIKGRLLLLISKLERILAAEQRATSLPSVQLQVVVDCAREDLDAQLVNLNASLSPINRLIGTVNALMLIAGLDCIPVLNDLSALSDTLIVPLDATIELLESIRDAINVPSVGFGSSQPFTLDCDTKAPAT